MNDSVLQQRLKPMYWAWQHTPGFVRQGDWFFVPSPGFTPGSSDMITYNEPIHRLGHAPHVADMLYRAGDETVYVCAEYPLGLTEQIYRELIAHRPEAEDRDWHEMRRNPEVYAKGEVRHPDYRTIVLPFWHRVLMCSEDGSVHMVFLD